MFKKLRNKFLFTNMALTLLILLATFAMLFSIVYWNARQESSLTTEPQQHKPCSIMCAVR